MSGMRGGYGDMGRFIPQASYGQEEGPTRRSSRARKPKQLSDDYVSLGRDDEDDFDPDTYEADLAPVKKFKTNDGPRKVGRGRPRKNEDAPLAGAAPQYGAHLGMQQQQLMHGGAGMVRPGVMQNVAPQFGVMPNMNNIQVQLAAYARMFPGIQPPAGIDPLAFYQALQKQVQMQNLAAQPQPVMRPAMMPQAQPAMPVAAPAAAAPVSAPAPAAPKPAAALPSEAPAVAAAPQAALPQSEEAEGQE